MKPLKPTHLFSLIFAICLFSGFQLIDHLSPSQKRGKLIYTKGLRANENPINAQLSGATFDAKILPCANCHGDKGEGNPEGGIKPSILKWSVLTKPYTVEFKNGRKRKGYNPESLKKAIVDGIDPNGNELDQVMPRYDLTSTDIKDLISYLKIIDEISEPGVSESSITIGALTTLNKKYRAKSEAVFNTMKAYLDLVNEAGGLYNRKFRIIGINEDSIALMNLKSQDIFAIIGPDLEHTPEDIKDKIQKNNIPIIGAISGAPKNGDYLKNDFYYLMPGLIAEVKELIRFTAKNLDGERAHSILIYDPSFPVSRDKVEQLISKTPIQFVEIPIEATDKLKWLNTLSINGLKNIIYLGNKENTSDFIDRMTEAKGNQNILIPGKNAPLNTKESNHHIYENLYLSYPNWITERDANAMAQYHKMVSNYALENQYTNAQINALTAIILFTEVMKTTGKEVSRISFLEALHKSANFKSGFMPALTFMPNKRVGSEKIFIVKREAESTKYQVVNQTIKK